MPTASPRLARKSAQRTLIPRPIVAIQEIWRAHDWQARHLRRGADRDAAVRARCGEACSASRRCGHDPRSLGATRTKENPVFINRIVTLLAALRPATVQAHCDTAEGPAVKDGRKALATGNINYALKWIPADGEAELRDIFDKALRVRTLGVDAAELADRLFLETMVRIHRMGEGVGFTGIQPVGTRIDPVVTAADEAIAQGSDAVLLPMVPQERRAELDKRFHAVLAIKDFDVDDVAAGRRYLAAYVSFFKYAEGEDHEHHGHERLVHSAHDHGHEH